MSAQRSARCCKLDCQLTFLVASHSTRLGGRLTGGESSPLRHFDVIHHLPIPALDRRVERDNGVLLRLLDEHGDGRVQAKPFMNDTREYGHSRDLLAVRISGVQVRLVRQKELTTRASGWTQQDTPREADLGSQGGERAG